MQLISTRIGPDAGIWSFRDALFHGQAPDGGLFVPATLPPLPTSDRAALSHLNFPERSFIAARHLLGNEIPDDILRPVIHAALDFPVPLRDIEPGIHLLELFHGPTHAFKDVGARFSARQGEPPPGGPVHHPGRKRHRRRRSRRLRRLPATHPPGLRRPGPQRPPVAHLRQLDQHRPPPPPDLLLPARVDRAGADGAWRSTRIRRWDCWDCATSCGGGRGRGAWFWPPHTQRSSRRRSSL